MKEQQDVIAQEKRGTRGMTSNGQPAVKSAKCYEIRYSEALKAHQDDPNLVPRSVVDQSLKMWTDAETFHYYRGANKSKDFDTARVEAYKGRGLTEKAARQMVTEENKGSRREYLREDIDAKKAKRAEFAEDRKAIPHYRTKDERDADQNGWEWQRRNLNFTIENVDREIRAMERELKSLDGAQKQMANYGLDSQTLDKIFNATFGGGSFSAYDVMRGGIEKDYKLDEMRKQTHLLETLPNIEEKLNLGQD
ncbi:MAG: hypothetical protein LBI05_12010 [Planctomycetaceae bacterium]|nr:hypothetical protein [Planctomycetaceae bacterium]